MLAFRSLDGWTDGWMVGLVGWKEQMKEAAAAIHPPVGRLLVGLGRSVGRPAGLGGSCESLSLFLPASIDLCMGWNGAKQRREPPQSGRWSVGRSVGSLGLSDGWMDGCLWLSLSVRVTTTWVSEYIIHTHMSYNQTDTYIHACMHTAVKRQSRHRATN